MTDEATPLLLTDHKLRRATWTCTCGQLWPCQLRRDQMLDEYSGSLYTLRTVMAEFFYEAVADGAPREVEELRKQLVGWLPPRRI